MCVDKNKNKPIHNFTYVLFTFYSIYFIILLSTPCDIDFNIGNAFKKLTITFSSSGRFQVPAQPRISHAMMAFAYQCAGNVIRSRTAQMDPMRAANVVSIVNRKCIPMQARRRSTVLWICLDVDCDIIGLTVWP